MVSLGSCERKWLLRQASRHVVGWLRPQMFRAFHEDIRAVVIYHWLCHFLREKKTAQKISPGNVVYYLGKIPKMLKNHQKYWCYPLLSIADVRSHPPRGTWIVAAWEDAPPSAPSPALPARPPEAHRGKKTWGPGQKSSFGTSLSMIWHNFTESIEYLPMVSFVRHLCIDKKLTPLDWYIEPIRRFVGLYRHLRVYLIVIWIPLLAYKLRITTLWLPCLPGRIPNQLLHWKQDPFWPFWPLHQVHHKSQTLWTEKNRPHWVNSSLLKPHLAKLMLLLFHFFQDKVLDAEVEQLGMPTYPTYSKAFDHHLLPGLGDHSRLVVLGDAFLFFHAGHSCMHQFPAPGHGMVQLDQLDICFNPLSIYNICMYIYIYIAMYNIIHNNEI